MNQKERLHDRIRGSMIGGAVGDALGYPIEFWSERQIFSTFGKNGIGEYVLSAETGKALISDDTQMTLFTANGILVGQTRLAVRGIGGYPTGYVARAYLDWLKTQTSSMDEITRQERYSQGGGTSWLLDVPELYHRRAPGNTCLSALTSYANHYEYGTLDHPINGSKGCGGIMRVAPLALAYRIRENYYGSIEELDRIGAELAAITHGHSLGYMPAAVVTHILDRILTEDGAVDLKSIILDARGEMTKLFTGDPHLDELTDVIDRAVALSENDHGDLENIHELGEGWVAEETLGISLYCALRHQDDFSGGVMAAVNHKGDSDSTGAVTGNILGAIVGFKGIEDRWKRSLELYTVITEMADDLFMGVSDGDMSESWETKYIYMHWKNPDRY